MNGMCCRLTGTKPDTETNTEKQYGNQYGKKAIRKTIRNIHPQISALPEDRTKKSNLSAQNSSDMPVFEETKCGTKCGLRLPTYPHGCSRRTKSRTVTLKVFTRIASVWMTEYSCLVYSTARNMMLKCYLTLKTEKRTLSDRLSSL